MKTYVIIAEKNIENDKFLVMNENADFSNVGEMVEYNQKYLIRKVRFLQLNSFLRDVSTGIKFDNSIGYCRIKY